MWKLLSCGSRSFLVSVLNIFLFFFLGRRFECGFGKHRHPDGRLVQGLVSRGFLRGEVLRRLWKGSREGWMEPWLSRKRAAATSCLLLFFFWMFLTPPWQGDPQPTNLPVSPSHGWWPRSGSDCGKAIARSVWSFPASPGAHRGLQSRR